MFQFLSVPELDDRLATESMTDFVDTPLWSRPRAIVSWDCYLGAGRAGAEPGGVLGVLVLGETLNTDGPKAFVLIVAVLVVIIATIALARGEAATMDTQTGRDERNAAPDAQPRDESAEDDARPSSDPSVGADKPAWDPPGVTRGAAK